MKVVQRKNLSEQVFQQLRDGILGGTYAPGTRFPTERELCDALGVNRSSIREALGRLQQIRLLDVRQGAGGVVLDWREHAGFELLADLVAPSQQIDPLLVRSTLEFRTTVVTEMTRLAALRATPAHHAELTEIVDRIEARDENDGEALQDLDLEFHRVLSRACESPAYALVFNSVRAIYEGWRAIYTAIFTGQPRARALYRPWLEALVAREAELAAALCQQQIRERDGAFWGAFA